MLGFLVGFCVLAAVFTAVEARWPARAQPRWRQGVRTDLVYWLLGPPVSRALTAATAVLVIAAVAALAGVPLDRAHVTAFVHRPTWFHDLPRAAQIVAVLVIGDGLGYAVHRALHGARLWRFHAVHHSSRDVDWLSAVRGHPVDELLLRVLQIVPALVVGVEPTVVAAFVPALGLLAIALHANVTWTFGPLRYVIASPAFHRWHHATDAAARGKNFAGLFPAWDLLFGTFFLPRGAQPVGFGVAEPVPEGVLGQLAWPFRSSARPRAPAARAPAGGSAPTPTSAR